MPSAPPSPLEIHRKLSVHSVVKPQVSAPFPISGTESESDSALSPDILSTAAAGIGGTSASVNQGPLSSIAERRSGSGEDSEDEEDVEEGGWKTANAPAARPAVDEVVIKAGYLWKKGERRKTWKKRWFVLRPAHLAYYKTSAEYQLLRLLELSDIHSCSKVPLKKHENAFGLVSPTRTFYLQAKTSSEVMDWVKVIEETRQTLMATSTQSSVSTPIPIPIGRNRSNSRPHPPITPSPPSHFTHSQNVTSSDSEDASPSGYRSYSNASATQRLDVPSSPTKSNFASDPAKIILSGYLMKCGSKRRNWRKRWFVLSGDKLVYSGSHMDTKVHRQFHIAEILDALEYTVPSQRQNATVALPSSPVGSPLPDALDSQARTFKVVTTKRNLLLCAPNEEDEIKWLGAIRALIARRTGETNTPASRLPPVNNDAGSSSVSPQTKASKGRRMSASSSGFSGLESTSQART